MSAQHKRKVARSTLLISLLVSAGVVLSGCGGERSEAGAQNQGDLVINTPQDIAQESAELYDDNRNGLITGKTLKSWIDNWEQNRPKGINGKLVILQQTKGPAGYEFIKPNNKNVFTYLENGWREPRSNGVTEIAGIVISGPTIDNLIRKYGIDVQNDLIVCAQGTGGSAAMDQGRCWYSFRYWGVEAKNLAVLNGGNNHLNGSWTADDFQSVTTINGDPEWKKHPSPIINRQVSSVRDLKVDNTSLQATLEDVINALPTSDVNNKEDGYFLWDGRSLDQYSAGEASEPGGALADRYSSFQNAGSRQSHPRGAVQLNWTNFIDSSTGLYKTKAQIRAYLQGEVDEFGKGFVDGTYQHLGAGNAYQKGDIAILWCETSARAAVTQIASAVILGLPTRLYDAAMIEWNSLTAGGVDKNGIEILPANSTWDTSALSAPFFVNEANKIAARNAYSDPENPAATNAPRIVNPYADHAGLVIAEDKAYKQPAKLDDQPSNGGSSGGSSGGSGLAPNPCGG